jgi:hypothetical protein
MDRTSAAVLAAVDVNRPTLSVPLLEAQPTIVMANCIHNQLESLGNRYLKVTPEAEPKNLNYKLVLRICDYLSEKIAEFFRPEFNFHQYVKAKPGATRKRFLKAYSQMLQGQRNILRNSKISAFVKNERYFEEGKSPRMIMGRDPKFNIIYARFIARLEDAFFQLPQVANACDYAKCGKKFSDLFRLCNSMFENDMSKFEATQRKSLLTLEYYVYQKVLRLTGASEKEISDLSVIFAAKCFKPVVTGNGVKASFWWCRGSGDMDTSIGNGIINYIATMYFMAINFCSDECKLDLCTCKTFDKFVLKGDDSFGICPQPNLTNTYAWFGLDAKLIYRSDARNVEFCSGHYVRTSNGEWTYVQKLRKLVTSVSTCINPDIIKNGWLAHYLKSLGMMYSVLYRGVPIYEDFAKMLLTADDKHGINTNLIQGVSYGAYEAFKLGNTPKVDPCPETIIDIAEHNEMPLAQLEALRSCFSNSRITLPPVHMRRCNLKNKTKDTDFCDPGDTINTWVNKSELPPKTRLYCTFLETEVNWSPLEAFKKIFETS